MNYLSEVYGDSDLYAKCVAASIANGIPIYTLEIQCPKYLNAELNTHRIISKNYSSSRAIPLQVTLDEDIYLPLDIRKNQKGMQGYSNITKEELYDLYKHLLMLYENIDDILTAIDIIINPHKQTSSRYREAFALQKGIFTATEWDNFFRLRLAPDAQPEIQELARCMKKAMEQVEPKELQVGEWHLPYIRRNEIEEALAYNELCDNLGEDGYLGDGEYIGGNPYQQKDAIDELIKCSVARCARVSYKTHDKKDPTVEKDLELYDQLLSSRHMTPFEHQATPMKYPFILPSLNFKELWENGITHWDLGGTRWSGNFRGFIQHRQLVEEWNG